MKLFAADFSVTIIGRQDPRTLADIIGIFIDIIQLTIPIVAALALLAFLKGLVAFIAKAGDAKTHQEGRNLMIWGILALFVMLSVWGILQFFYYDLGFTNFGLPLLPTN